VSENNPQSFNRYAYAVNNPLNASDPSGLVVEDDSGGDWAILQPTDDLGWFTPGFGVPSFWQIWLPTIDVPSLNSIFDGEDGTGVPTWLKIQAPSLLSMILPQDQGCDFGPCNIDPQLAGIPGVEEFSGPPFFTSSRNDCAVYGSGFPTT